MGAILCVIAILTSFNIKKYLAYLYKHKHSMSEQRWDVYPTAKIMLLFVM